METTHHHVLRSALVRYILKFKVKISTLLYIKKEQIYKLQIYSEFNSANQSTSFPIILARRQSGFNVIIDEMDIWLSKGIIYLFLIHFA